MSYLVAPPKTKAQLEQEQADREHNVIREDPMVNVDMTPWPLDKKRRALRRGCTSGLWLVVCGP